jgi:23S rRNA pseudouridine1911/1915/1917 synthase
MAQHLTLKAETSERLDQFLARRLAVLTRSQAQRLITEGNVSSEGQTRRPSWKLHPGDVVEVELPDPVQSLVEAEEIPLDVLYEDSDVIVVNKAAGMTVHPAPGHQQGTLVNALLAHCPDLSGIGGVMRPGIVHRLDKDTSGVMVVAKNQRAHLNLSNQIKERSVLKMYLALVKGKLPVVEGVIDAPIGRDTLHRKKMAVVSNGRPARTDYRVLAEASGHSLVVARIHTGRTHQVRVHFSAVGNPVAGDRVYGGASATLDRQFLHAWRLGFRLPGSGEWEEFTAPLPPDLQDHLTELGFDSSLVIDLLPTADLFLK